MHRLLVRLGAVALPAALAACASSPLDSSMSRAPSNDGATASAPIDPEGWGSFGWASKIGFQVWPKSVVFQTPPLFGAI